MRSKKAIYSIITNLMMQAAAIIYGFVIPKIIIDYFGSDVNGLITSITQFLAYITLLESGFGPVVRSMLYKPIAKKDNATIASILKTSEKFFRRIALIFILYIIVLCFVFPVIVKSDFDTIFTVSLILIIAISTFAEYFFGMIYKLFLRAEQKTYVVSIIQTITYILSVVVVVIMAIAGANVLVIKLATGIIFILRPVLQNLYVKKKYQLDLKDASNNYPIKQKWDGLSQHVAAVIHGNTDVVVLTLFTSLAEVSVYSVYYLVVTGVNRIVQSFDNGLDASFGDMIARGEDENLRKKFSSYELLYMMVVTLIFTVTLLLITPFVGLYTNGVTDADYMRPVFGYLLVMSEFVWAIRLPYNSITLAAGHFRETRKGAWVEAGVNIVVSLILVFNLGLIGVAVGTLVAMLIRGAEFIYHANKYILKRSVWFSIRKILTTIVAMALVFLIFQVVKIPTINNYKEWIFDAILVFLVSSAVILLLFGIIYKNEMKEVLLRVKKIANRSRKRR